MEEYYQDQFVADVTLNVVGGLGGYDRAELRIRRPDNSLRIVKAKISGSTVVFENNSTTFLTQSGIWRFQGLLYTGVRMTPTTEYRIRVKPLI